MVSVHNLQCTVSAFIPYRPLCLGEDRSVLPTYSKGSQVISPIFLSLALSFLLPSPLWFVFAYISKRFKLGSKRFEEIQRLLFTEVTTAPNRPCRRAHSLKPIRPQDIVCKSHICRFSKVYQFLPQRNGVGAMKWNEIQEKSCSLSITKAAENF